MKFFNSQFCHHLPDKGCMVLMFKQKRCWSQLECFKEASCSVGAPGFLELVLQRSLRVTVKARTPPKASLPPPFASITTESDGLIRAGSGLRSWALFYSKHLPELRASGWCVFLRGISYSEGFGRRIRISRDRAEKCRAS